MRQVERVDGVVLSVSKPAHDTADRRVMIFKDKLSAHVGVTD